MPIKHEIIHASGNDEQVTALTVGIMSSLAREDAKHPAVINAALEASHFNAARPRGIDPNEKARAVWGWIRRNVRFREDSDSARALGLYRFSDQAVELLIRPADLVTMDQWSRGPRMEDCDGQSMLAASMLGALGIDSEFVTMAADKADPSVYSHVYTEALLPSGRLALDCSHGPYPGWSAPPVGKLKRWKVNMCSCNRKMLQGIEGPYEGSGEGGGGAAWWQDLLVEGARAGTQIARARYGVPPPGTYQQNGNSILYRPASGSAFAFPGVNVGLGGSNTGTLLLGAGALALIIFATRRK